MVKTLKAIPQALTIARNVNVTGSTAAVLIQCTQKAIIAE
jgi:hypothetical protein